MKNGDFMIYVTMPIIRSERKIFKYDLMKLRSVPFDCLNEAYCDTSEKYILKNRENNILALKDDQLLATFKREDLDCKGHMGEQICWTRLDERVLIKDSCINALDTQDLKYECEFSRTDLPIVPIKTKQYIFRIFEVKGVLTLERRGAEKEEVQALINLLEALQTTRLKYMPKLVLNPPVIKGDAEMRANMEAIRKEILDEKMEKGI